MITGYQNFNIILKTLTFLTLCTFLNMLYYLTDNLCMIVWTQSQGINNIIWKRCKIQLTFTHQFRTSLCTSVRLSLILQGLHIFNFLPESFLKQKNHILEIILFVSQLVGNKIKGSSEEDEVSGFFVLSHLWMRGYFRLG